jgi:hypothetical protein
MKLSQKQTNKQASDTLALRILVRAHKTVVKYISPDLLVTGKRYATAARQQQLPLSSRGTNGKE